MRQKPVVVQPRSIHYYEDRGYIVTTVEKWKEFPDKKTPPCKECERGYNIKIRADLWNFADLMCVRPNIPSLGFESDIVLVQVTTRHNLVARYLKVLEFEEAKICLAANVRIEVHGWEQEEGKGSRWTVEIREVKFRDFQSMRDVSDIVSGRLAGSPRKSKKGATEAEPELFAVTTNSDDEAPW